MRLLYKKSVFLVFVMLSSFGVIFNCFCAEPDKISKSVSLNNKEVKNSKCECCACCKNNSVKKTGVNKNLDIIDAKYQKFVDEYKKIKIEDIILENKNIKNSDFLFGLGTSSYQVEGDDGASEEVYCQWKAVIGKKVEIEVGDKKEYKVISDPGVACEHWKRYKEDIKLVKNFGCNAYRFSISWGKVAPKPGEFNKKAIDHYEDVCKELKKQGIRPIITLYHYAHPMWFENKGAFEKEENIKYFVDYCMMMFERLNKYNPIWFTINTFTGTSLHAYYMGTKPPFKKDMGLALKVLKNLLQAHVEFYRKAKKCEKESASTIGIYKIIFPIDKYRSWQIWDSVGVSFVDKINNSSIYDFFTKGILDINIGIPVLGMKNSIKYKNKEAIGAADCVGLNYYTGAYMSNFKVVPRADGIPTQSSLATVYPDGFYDALKQVDSRLAKKLKIPIYVTENGIATNNSHYRDVYYRSHFNALSKAMKEGVDVRGYMVWALMDSFDWMEGYDFEYGVYSVDRKTQERTLKPGTEFLFDVIKSHNKVENKDLVSKKAGSIKEPLSGESICNKVCCDTKLILDSPIETKPKIENSVVKNLQLGESNFSENQDLKKYSKKTLKN